MEQACTCRHVAEHFGWQTQALVGKNPRQAFASTRGPLRKLPHEILDKIIVEYVSAFGPTPSGYRHTPMAQLRRGSTTRNVRGRDGPVTVMQGQARDRVTGQDAETDMFQPASTWNRRLQGPFLYDLLVAGWGAPNDRSPAAKVLAYADWVGLLAAAAVVVLGLLALAFSSATSAST